LTKDWILTRAEDVTGTTLDALPGTERAAVVGRGAVAHPVARLLSLAARARAVGPSAPLGPAAVYWQHWNKDGRTMFECNIIFIITLLCPLRNQIIKKKYWSFFSFHLNLQK